MREGRSHVIGEVFTAADAYLLTVLNWTELFKIDLSTWPNIQTYLARVGARSKVQEAMSAEGLIP